MRPRDNSRNKKQPKYEAINSRAPASLIEDESKKIVHNQSLSKSVSNSCADKSRAKRMRRLPCNDCVTQELDREQIWQTANQRNSSVFKHCFRQNGQEAYGDTQKRMYRWGDLVTQFYCELKMEHLEDTLKGAGIKNK